MRRKKLKFAIAGAIGFLIGFLTTIRSAPAQQRFDLKVREDFFAGLAGNQEALDRGMKACEAALATDPKNAEAMVWHGSGLYFQAGRAFQAGDQQKGMDLWTRGLKEMKTAEELAPDAIGVLIPRGAVLLAGSRFAPPDMAKPLIEQGVSDYQHAFDLQKDRLATLGSHPKGELLFGLAEGYGRLGEEAKAREYFELILKDLPNTAYAKRASLWMETKSLPAEQTRCVGCHVAKQ
jgi:tetratricopeptide (TPR) repeat protein